MFFEQNLWYIGCGDESRIPETVSFVFVSRTKSGRSGEDA